MGEDPPCNITRLRRKPIKLGAQTNGRAGRRLQDVDLPFRVGAVRDVQSDAREPLRFVSGPRLPAVAKAKPAASQQKPSITIHIEPFLLGPSAWSGGSFLFGRLEHVAVRQYVTLSGHTGGVEDTIVRTLASFAGMSHQKRVPRLHGPAVEKELELGLWAIDQPMEGHRKVRFHMVSQLDHVIGCEAVCHDTVERFPQDHAPVLHTIERFEQVF